MDGDAKGKKLADIRTPEENNLAADMIVNFIRKLCADEKIRNYMFRLRVT